MNFLQKITSGVKGFFPSIHEDASIKIKEASGGSTSGQITSANIKNFTVKAVGNVSDDLTTDFNSPEADLSEIRDAISADSYIKLAVTKYSQLIFKAGYNIVSENDAAAEYIQSRLNWMSFMAGTPMDIIYQQIAEDLVSYSNAFLIKSRVAMTNIGGMAIKGVFSNQPVGGYFRVDPTTMQIKVDATGTIKNYQQEVGNTTKSYKPEDVIHFYIDKQGGALFGTPRLESALEDVKILRKIEGNVLKLIYRYSAPLMQMKIGLPEVGFRATEQEIKEARQEVEKLSDDGLMITNEATEFKTIGAEGQALDASSYLKYFEARVFSALSLSNAMAGRSGAKQDADSMEEQVHDTVKFFQRQFKTFFENSVIIELLLEGGYDPLNNMTDMVNFQFNEINLDTQVKMETHAMNMFQGNAIPYEEMRNQLGLKNNNVDESRLYSNMITHANEVDLLNIKLGASSTDSSTANSGTTGPDKETKTPDTAKNIMSPQNQNGTSSAKIKENLSINESVQADKNEVTKANKADYRKNFSAIYKKYNTVRNEICEDVATAAISLPLIRDSINDSLTYYISSKAEEGYMKCIKDAGKSPDMNLNMISAVLLTQTKNNLTTMFKDIQKKLKKTSTRAEREAAFDSSEYRLRFLTEHVASKAYWYAYVKTARALKIAQVHVEFNQGSDDKKEHNKTINTSHFSLDDIPAFHPYCKCRLGIKKAGEK